MAHFIGRKVRIKTENRSYEGFVRLLDQQNHQISLDKVTIPESGKRLNGLQTFFQGDIDHIQVLVDECKKVEKEDSIVSDKREKGPRMLHSKYVPEHLKRLQDFEPSTHLLKNLTKDEKTVGVEEPSKPANKSSDYDSSSDQEDLDYEDCFYISKLNQRFHDVISHIKEQPEIGVALTGVCIGRNGELSIIQMATTKDVFIFDIIQLGPNCWDLGLKSVFEDSKISKVMHDCRFPSDMLHHKYGVKLVNIFDTQVAEVFVYKLYHHGDWPKWVSGLSCSLFDHLDIPTDMVNNLKTRENLKKEDQEVWLHRPLPKNLLKVAIKEVVHLLQLRHVLSEKMMGEYIAGVDVYLSYVREASKEDYKKYQHNTHKLPGPFDSLSGLLVSRDSHRYKRHRYNRGPPIEHDYNKDSTSGFRENCRGFVGTDVRYSNSSIWHESFKRGSKSDDEKQAKTSTTSRATSDSEISSPSKPSRFLSQSNTQETRAYSGPEESSPGKESGNIASGEPQVSGRNSLLKTPLSVLEDLKRNAIRGQGQPSTSHDQISTNEYECNKVGIDDMNENQAGDRKMTIGSLIRSKLVYNDSDSDIDLVPAGRMLQGKTLHKLKDKRMTEIDEMSSRIEKLKTDAKESDNFYGFDVCFESSAPKSKITSLLEPFTPKTEDVSISENYITAPTTPNQSIFNSFMNSSNNQDSLNTSEVENYKTAPSTPALNTSILERQKANASLSQITESCETSIGYSGNTHSTPKSPTCVLDLSSCSGSSMSLSESPSKMNGISTDLLSKLRRTQKPLSSPSSSVSSSDCPPLFTFETNQSIFRNRFSPVKGANSFFGGNKEENSSLQLGSKDNDTSSLMETNSPLIRTKSNEAAKNLVPQSDIVQTNQNEEEQATPLKQSSPDSSILNQPSPESTGLKQPSPGSMSVKLKSTTSRIERLKMLQEAARKKKF